ncbi:hypothetical protein [Streptomyces platensis]|uniref:hypothetical protein n=1 Tax=Streptomyces platensis TaxID=58346 RepID=UPI0036870339
MSPPETKSPPVGYVHPGDGIQHVNYLGSDDHVHELWWNGAWHDTDLCTMTDAPTGAFDVPSGYVHLDGTQHVNYLGTDEHVHELWWNGAWHHNDLSVAAGAPAGVQATRVGRGYAHPGDRTQHVPYLGSDNHVHELWWDDGWHHNDLTAAAGALANVSGRVYGYVHPGDGTQHVNYRDASRHVHELWWDGDWHHNDLTAAAHAPANASGTAYGYVHPGEGTQHVNYFGTDDHVHELRWSGNWQHNDLTAAAHALNGNSFTDGPSGYAHPGDGTQHVLYIGSDFHVHELWWDGNWHHNDLSVAAGAHSLAFRTVFGYVHPGDGTQHVNYLDSSLHVQELWWNGPWHFNDLTLAAS